MYHFLDIHYTFQLNIIPQTNMLIGFKMFPKLTIHTMINCLNI